MKGMYLQLIYSFLNRNERENVFPGHELIGSYGLQMKQLLCGWTNIPYEISNLETLSANFIHKIENI